MKKGITKEKASTIIEAIKTLGLSHLTDGSIALQTLTSHSKENFVRLLPKMVVFLKEVGDSLRPKEKENIHAFIESLCIICQDEAFILENSEVLHEVDEFFHAVWESYNGPESNGLNPNIKN